ncbi:MAG: sigma-70 family RNA polymerase sigma factor [Candidatus Kapabacteria bacterium]|nr:sigma-70 family RNA polymerase sigma factor [Candidatus Kapabacteria bacterium]
MIDDAKKQAIKEEDLATVQRCLEGDINAFALLQKRYTGIVTSLIRRMVKNEEDVQDLVQETFIKAYKALPSFQSLYSFSSWLYRIASNNCIDFHRKKRVQTISLNMRSPSSEDEEEYEISDTDYTPDLRILDEEKKRCLDEAFAKLPENYKQIMKLRHEEDMDYVQISEKLNLPLGTVKAHLFRARKMLYEQLKQKKYLFTS